MPTPTGMPKVGETIQWTHKDTPTVEGEVLRRSSGHMWGLQVKWKSGPLAGQTKWITEGAYWMKRGNLRVKVDA